MENNFLKIVNGSDVDFSRSRKISLYIYVCARARVCTVLEMYRGKNFLKKVANLFGR